MKIAIGCDHVGLELKDCIAEHLKKHGHTVQDFGTNSGERTDYPIYANKVRGVRAVVCSEPYSALLSRRHNDTNVLALGARVVGRALALMIVDAWLMGEYEGGRHAKRVEMLAELDDMR